MLSMKALMNASRFGSVVFLTLLFFAGVVCGQTPGGGEEKKPFRDVNVEEFSKLRDVKTNVVLDVRTAREFKSGHIPGAILMDVNDPEFRDKVKTLDKGKLYLVHCAAGVRSAKACKIMSTLEFTNLVNLKGGFRAWEAEGKPVEK
jgi:rhodanese-related sulfurtransferase